MLPPHHSKGEEHYEHILGEFVCIPECRHQAKYKMRHKMSIWQWLGQVKTSQIVPGQ
ncbi:hypothetical protein GBA52_002492 [Prunus armeniaca]|nr:hypothetical protein GBA52_002492 [Prunus armeniaca]